MGLTYGKLKERRSKEKSEYNCKMFSKKSDGIRSGLPKFADNPVKAAYWKIAQDCESGNNSRIKLLQERKYWTKPEDYVLADTSNICESPYLVKKDFELKKKRAESCLKVNEVNLFSKEPTDLNVESRRALPRWTSTIRKFDLKDRGAYDENPNERSSLLKQEQAPMYSSFAPDKVFEDPLSKSKSKLKQS
jgi:hypothetical protein